MPNRLLASSASTSNIRAARQDGDATRGRILEAAGQLFSGRGYANTTSKAICEAAGANMAAVNYHFGSRDALYVAVLRQVHAHVLSLAFIHQLADSDLPARAKLERFVDGVCANLSDIAGWQAHLWARELLAPSALLAEVIEAEALPKFDVLKHILADILAVPAGDPALLHSAMSVIAPFIMMLVMNPDLPGPAQAVRRSPPALLATHMKAFVLGGLEAVRLAHTAPR